MEAFFTKKFAELKLQILSAWQDIKGVGLFNTSLVLLLSILFYFLSIFAIKILIRKYKELEAIRKPLRKLIFYLFFFKSSIAN